jgi:trk system potassium uptake protein TrkA
MPKDFLIAMIQNRGRIMVANGNRILSPGDTVIVITSPKHAPELGKIF